MITFNNLSVGFDNHSILNAINGSAKQGQLVALLGENGAGKSTLLHTLAGMHSFTGSVLLITRRWPLTLKKPSHTACSNDAS
ncbi:ATP-binding cassette domain-containing protein [Pseudoalteromonas sp. B193]